MSPQSSAPTPRSRATWVLATCLVITSHAARAQNTTWLGGAGLWDDPARWTNGVPLDNNVFIDGGNGLASTVTLSGDPTSARNLTIDADDALNIESRLTFRTSPPSTVRNDGRINLGTETAGAILEFASGIGSLTLTGDGTIALSNHADNIIRAFADDQTLIQESGHTIRGSGSIAPAVLPSFKFHFQNAGAIIADQSVPLTISPGLTLTNTGTLMAANGGTLHVRQSDIDPFAISGEFVSAGGTFSASGVGSTINVEIPGASFDGDRFEANDGGTINLQLPASATNVARMKDVTFAGDGTIAIVAGSRIALEGTIRNESALAAGDSTNSFLLIDGDVTLTGGGSIDLRGTIFLRPGAEPATLTNEDNTIQIAGAINSLNIDNHGTIRSVGNLAINLFNVGAPLLVTNRGTIEAGEGDRVTISSTSPATLDNQGGTIAARGEGSTARLTLLVGSTISGGTFEASGQNAVVEALNNPIGDATFRALDGGTVQLFAGLTNFDPSTRTLTGGTYEARAGTIEVAGLDVVSNRATIILDAANGPARLIDDAGQNALRNLAFNSETGQLTIERGVDLTSGDAGFTNSGLLSIGADSTFTVGGENDYLQDGGLTELLTTDSTLAVAEGRAVHLVGGELRGIGTILGDLINDAVVSPGLSPGVLTVAGDFTQGSGGLLDIQIGGIAPGTGFSQLSVDGRAILGGTLRLSLINGFTPLDGQSFLIVAAGAIDGRFANLEIVARPGQFFRLSQGGDGLTATAFLVPEPASLVASSFGVIGLLLAASRRRRPPVTPS